MDDAAIWRKYKEELIRYATVLVGVDHAEDVLSTVVERVLRRKGSLAKLDDARPYLFRAVLNESRGRVRRQRVIPWERDFVEDHIGFRPDVAAAVGALPSISRTGGTCLWVRLQTSWIVDRARSSGISTFRVAV